MLHFRLAAVDFPFSTRRVADVGREKKIQNIRINLLIIYFKLRKKVIPMKKKTQHFIFKILKERKKNMYSCK